MAMCETQRRLLDILHRRPDDFHDVATLARDVGLAFNVILYALADLADNGKLVQIHQRFRLWRSNELPENYTSVARAAGLIPDADLHEITESIRRGKIPSINTRDGILIQRTDLLKALLGLDESLLGSES